MGCAQAGRCHSLCSEKSNGGTRAISPRLSASGRPRQGIRPSAGSSQKLRALHQRLRIGGGIEMAEHIGPGRRRRIGPTQHRAAAALAVGEAAQRLDGDAGVFRRANGGGSERRARARIILGILRPPARGADIDDGRSALWRARRPTSFRHIGQCHPRCSLTSDPHQSGCSAVVIDTRAGHSRRTDADRRQGTPPGARLI